MHTVPSHDNSQAAPLYLCSGTHQGRLRGNVEGGWPLPSGGAGGSGCAVAGGAVSCTSAGRGGGGSVDVERRNTALVRYCQGFLCGGDSEIPIYKACPKKPSSPKVFMRIKVRFQRVILTSKVSLLIGVHANPAVAKPKGGRLGLL